MKHIFSSFALLMTLPLGALELHPEGVLNPRIPIVAPAKGGAVGCFMPLANIDFIYSVSPHLKEMRSGNADFLSGIFRSGRCAEFLSSLKRNQDADSL